VVRFVGYSIVKIEKVEVNSDKTTRLGDIKMSTENVSVGEVVVVAQKPPIEKDRTFSESSINSKTIESLPVTTLEEVIQLQPGVVNEGGELHFRGGRGREVSYMIDGIAVTNDFNQGGGNNVSIENSMVQEVEVISGTFNAEYGSAQSGVVNIVTKGPAKTFSGSVSAYSGAWTSNKTDVFLGINKFNPAAEKDIQFSLSGPILTDKLGFFTSGRYNSSSSYLMYQKMFNTLDGWKIAAYQQWYQEHNPEQASESQAIYIPDSLRTGDMSTGPLHTSNSFSFNAKLDFNPVNSIRIGYQVFGSYSQSSDGDASRRYQPDDLPTNINTSQQHFLTFRDAPTDNFFYSISLSFQRDHWDSYYRKDNKVSQYPGDPGIQPITTSADGFSLGTTGGFYTGSDSKNYRNQYLATGNFNWQIDRNNFIKAGFEFKQHEINTYSWGYIETNQWETKMWPSKDLIDPQKLSFDQYWDKVVDYWKNWEQTYDTTMYRKYTSDEYTLWRDYTIRPMQAAAYIQDKLELGEIIINGGLRLDVFNPNEKYPVNDRIESYLLGSEQNLRNASVKYQLSPRLGISFPISANGAFHAAYGHFFQMPSFEYMYNEPLYALTPLQLNGKLLGNANLDPEKTVSYEIGLQQSITGDLGIDVTAYYKDFRNLLGIEQVTTVDAIGYQKFINRDYGYSKGITIGLKEGGSGFITGAINYTLSFSNGSSVCQPDRR
jgi:outer membrane receptor protein involved in Fe transport